ncbi:MAG: hypothetical protein HWN51_05150, partial [Desulfobacterales bacterium]|nr:hypothetical protein [Desulfobacterales bacterium]
MNESPLTVKCYPTQDLYEPGGPVSVRVELENKTNRDIEVLAAGVPWTFHHAIRFSLTAGAREGVTFENRLWVLEPPAVPDITIAPGKAVSGEVDLAGYLYTQDDRSISEVPGTYTVRARLLTFV